MNEVATAHEQWLTVPSIRRLVRDLFIAEMKQFRSQWHTPGDDDSLALDARERVRLAKRLNQFFHLHEWEREETLHQRNTIGELAEGIAETVLDAASPWRNLTVCTSGSTGEPKPVTYLRARLEAEVNTWRRQMPEIARVVSFIPSHHMYGLIWTVLLPGATGSPVETMRPVQQPELQAGDLVVAVPHHWELLDEMGLKFPAGVCGVSSAGQLPSGLWQRLTACGLECLLEVYGSTETGGVAWRERAGDAYRWAPHASRDIASLPDEIAFESADTFRLLGRKDGSVKVRGQLVSPARVEAVLRSVPGIDDCRVRASRQGLEALLIHSADVDLVELEQMVRLACSEQLSTPAQPGRLVFARELPRNEMGKVTVW